MHAVVQGLRVSASRARWLAAASLLLLGLALRWRGCTQSLWYDEIWRTSVVLNRANLQEVLLNDVHNPLYNAFMYGWISLFGDSEISIRLPSLLASVLAVAIFCRWIAERLGQAMAWWTAAALVVSPFHIWHSTEAKNNAVVGLFAVIALIASERMVWTSGRRAWWWGTGFVLSGAAAIWTSWSGAPALVGAIVGAAVAARFTKPETGVQRSAVWAKLAAAFVAIAIVLLPLVLYKSGRIETLMRAHPRHFDVRELLLLVGNFLVFGNALKPVQAYAVDAAFAGRLALTIAQAAVGFVLLASGIRGLWRRTSSDGGPVAAVAWLVVPLAGMLAASYAMDLAFPDRRWYLYQERNLFWIVYPFALVVTVGAMDLMDILNTRGLRMGRSLSAGRWLVPGGVLVASLTAQVAIVTVNRDAWTIYKPNPQWREAATWVKARASQGREDPGRAATLEYATTPCDPLAYYLPTVERLVSPAGSDIRLTAATAFSERGGGLTDIFLFSQTHWWPLEESWVASGEAEGRYRVLARVGFGGLVIYHLGPTR